MFDIDTETFNTLWSSLIAVACMIGVMSWAVVKALGLINQDARKETKTSPNESLTSVQSVQGLLGSCHD